MPTFSVADFKSLIATITDTIADQALNQDLEDALNQQFPADGEVFQAITTACHAGIASGELAKYEGGGIKYGRAIKPTADLHGYSVDVVDMSDIAGPHHRHPLGEIDMIMPVAPSAEFDGRGAGWLVYGPDSAHAPTVSSGRALVLYLLPNGEIEFSRNG